MNERPLISVSRKTLDEGPKDIRSALPSEWLSRQLAETESLSASTAGAAELRITPAGGDNFLVQGRVRATVDTVCGRCLGAASVPVDAELTLLLIPKTAADARGVKGRKSKESEGEFEFDADEADIATYDGDTVVLDELVREAILLEMPISALCSEDCAGMASDPAAAEALGTGRIDPRLAKLEALRDKLPAGPSAEQKSPKK